MIPDLVRLVRHCPPVVFGAALAAALFFTAPAAWAAAAYAEHWNGPPSTQGWVANTAQAMVVGDDTVGLPPGSLASVFVPDGSAGPAFGMHSGANLELRGDFSGQVWNVSFDVRLLFGAVEGFALRYHVYDFPTVWVHPLPVPELDTWTHYAVQFDPGWTDDEAFDAGWLRENGAFASFATTMSYGTGTELRMQLADGAMTALMNLDNFVQVPGNSVPVPPTAALAMLGLAAAGAWRGRPRPRAARTRLSRRPAPAR